VRLARRHVNDAVPPELGGGDILRLSMEIHRDPRRSYNDMGVARTLWTPGDETTSRPRIVSNTHNSIVACHVGRIGRYVGYLAAGADYLQAPYTSDIAITSGDFFIGCWWFPGVASLPSKGTGNYAVSIQDATATAAGTAWGLFFGNTGDFYLVVSNGVTRQLLGPITGGVTGGAWNYLAAERYNGNVYLSINGVVGGGSPIAYANTLNIPSGGVVRIGNPLVNTLNYAETCYDALQVKRCAPYRGQSFSAPQFPNIGAWHPS
jgi:hypothetical protein